MLAKPTFIIRMFFGLSINFEIESCGLNSQIELFIKHIFFIYIKIMLSFYKIFFSFLFKLHLISLEPYHIKRLVFSISDKVDTN